jgi:hypothetical protein
VGGVDADAGMVGEADAEARRRGVANARFVHARAEQLPAGLGTFRAATFAQSFHWMDREHVAATVRDMLVPGGAWVHVNATTHHGADHAGLEPSWPPPPRGEIGDLVARYLGPVRRAGQGLLPAGTPAGEEEVMRSAGFAGPDRVLVPDGRVLERSEDDVVASVFSLSSAAPHLFGPRRERFETELRALLRRASPERRFSERAHDVELVIWRR